MNSLLDSILSPEQAPQDGINCLRCRHAQPLPYTDFSTVLCIQDGKVSVNTEAAVPIYCGKGRRNRPAIIFGACPKANPAPQYLHKARHGGDATGKTSAVERLFYRAVYPRWPGSRMEALAALTSRSRMSVGSICRKMKIARPLSVETVIHKTQLTLASRRASGAMFNEAQSRYACERQQSGDWPRQGGCNKGSYYQRRLALQNEIVEAVAQLGPRRTWRQIVEHVYAVSPAMRRKDRRTRPRKFLKAGVRG